MSVDDRHVSAPSGSTTMDITWDPKTASYSPRTGQELAKTLSDDDQHINAPRGSLISEITPGPQNGE